MFATIIKKYPAGKFNKSGELSKNFCGELCLFVGNDSMVVQSVAHSDSVYKLLAMGYTLSQVRKNYYSLCTAWGIV